MELLTDLCSVPTAPFVEQRVVGYVEDFVARRPGLKLSSDRAGNLLIELRGRGPRATSPRWVFAAHMDHPGFIARSMRDRRTLEADFRGGVLAEYFMGSRVRFFDGDAEITGVITDLTVGEERGYPDSVVVRVGRPVAAGAPGMWDQGGGRVRGKRFLSRVCDNLAGAAAALTMLQRVARKPPATPVAVLLTRAEEDGFIGAIAAATKPQLLRKSDRLVVIETSAKQPHAPQGSGAILRVGDRTSIFNSSLTYFIQQQAEALAKKDKSFKFQRALMPGGTCEATVYDIYGFTAASICVALGNYHNMDRERKKIAPEHIDIADWENMVKLFVRLAREGHAYEPGFKPLKERIGKRYEKLKGLL
jgi:endoglucanase